MLDRRTGRVVQQLTVTNNTGADITGPIAVVLTGLSGNTAVTNASGVVNGDPLVSVQSGTLAAGASATVAVQFTRPASGAITYGTQVVTGP